MNLLSLNNLRDRIENKTPIIFEHFYKIIAFGEDHPSTVHHWCTELGGFLKACNIKVKGKNKLLLPTKISDIMLSVYSDVKEFSSIGGELYSEYGYSKYKDSEIYSKLKQVLPATIEYIQSLEEEERVNPDKMMEIICN